jgi:hypothetical protein
MLCGQIYNESMCLNKRLYVRNNRILKLAHEYLNNHHIAHHVTLDSSWIQLQISSNPQLTSSPLRIKRTVGVTQLPVVR